MLYNSKCVTIPEQAKPQRWTANASWVQGQQGRGRGERAHENVLELDLDGDDS